MVGSIVAVDVLTRCVLVHFVWDKKVGQINLQRNLSRQLELSYNTAEESKKNICYVKDESTVGHSSVTKIIIWVERTLIVKQE